MPDSPNGYISKDKLLVEAIDNGTVIDHIPPGQAINILRLFNFLNKDTNITVGFKLRSRYQGQKDIIKISNVTFKPEETAQLAILAPNATINQIKDYQVISKYKLCLPDEIIGAFTCPNTNCITHVEQAATSRFRVSRHAEQIMLRCHYCERVFAREIILSSSNLDNQAPPQLSDAQLH